MDGTDGNDVREKLEQGVRGKRDVQTVVGRRRADRRHGADVVGHAGIQSGDDQIRQGPRGD